MLKKINTCRLISSEGIGPEGMGPTTSQTTAALRFSCWS